AQGVLGTIEARRGVAPGRLGASAPGLLPAFVRLVPGAGGRRVSSSGGLAYARRNGGSSRQFRHTVLTTCRRGLTLCRVARPARAIGRTIWGVCRTTWGVCRTTWGVCRTIWALDRPRPTVVSACGTADRRLAPARALRAA